jgi:PilZ domain
LLFVSDAWLEEAMEKIYASARIERRVPMTIAVRLEDEDLPLAETAFTTNVSSHGAQVLTSRRWRLNACVQLASMPGDFHARSRIAYCRSSLDNGEVYVIGVEFLEPSGRWVVDQPAATPGKI